MKPVASDEQLARFILHRGHLRGDLTVRPDAFIPHPRSDLSVTRHLQLSESELWRIGQEVARQVRKNLMARADVQAVVFERLRLSVIGAPLPENPNHANVTGWPVEKPAQKILAQEIAAAAGRAIPAPCLELLLILAQQTGREEDWQAGEMIAEHLGSHIVVKEDPVSHAGARGKRDERPTSGIVGTVARDVDERGSVRSDRVTYDRQVVEAMDVLVGEFNVYGTEPGPQHVLRRARRMEGVVERALEHKRTGRVRADERPGPTAGRALAPDPAN